MSEIKVIEKFDLIYDPRMFRWSRKILAISINFGWITKRGINSVICNGTDRLCCCLQRLHKSLKIQSLIKL